MDCTRHRNSSNEKTEKLNYFAKLDEVLFLAQLLVELTVPWAGVTSGQNWKGWQSGKGGAVKKKKQ